MMEEEEEEQQRALDQIEDCYEETRTWLVNINYWYVQLLTMLALNVPGVLARLVFAEIISTGARCTNV